MDNNRYFGYKYSVWNKSVKEIEKILVAKAKVNGQIFYSDLAVIVPSIEFQEPYHDLAYAIGELSESHHDNGRPMISVLVVRKEDGMCGDGFFKLAKELGHRFNNNLTFQAKETKKCYEYWKNHNI